MKNCIECQAELENEEIFCSECGSKQPEQSNSKTAAEIKENENVSAGEVVDDIKTSVSDQPQESSDSVFSKDEIIKDDFFIETSSEEIKSDCQHFKIEWNKGSSTFLANTISNLQFRITPKTGDASKAEKLAIHLKFPEDESWRKNDLRVRRLSFARNVNINYKPGNDVSGDCSVDFHFSYKIGKDLYCFEQQIQLHIHDDKVKLNGGIQGGLNINIGDIHQEGKAGDPNLNLLNGLYKEDKSSYEKLSSLHKETSWEVLQLFQAIPLENENNSIKKMIIPLAPSGINNKISLKIGEKTIMLYTGEITAGRSRDADYLLRNEPREGESWDMARMQTMNLSINKIHCKIGIMDNKALISDNNSTNGTYVNGDKLEDGSPSELDYHINYEVSLAQPVIYPRNILLELKVYPSTHRPLDPDENKETVPAGIVIKQRNKENVSAVVINRWVPLSAVVTEGANLFLTYRNKHFAVTDGKKWNWLVPGLIIELSKDLMIKVDKL